MLIVFNLEWKQYDIDRTVARAHAKMQRLVAERNLQEYAQYGFTSRGAGENLLPFASAEKKEEPPLDVIDALRVRHSRMKRAMERFFPNYRDFRAVAEVMASLRDTGHTLAVVTPGEKTGCEEVLKLARLRDHFEDRVYGEAANNPTLYLQIMKNNKVAAEDVLAVENDVCGVDRARKAGAHVVALVALEGVSSVWEREVEQSMKDAGAERVITNVRDVLHLSGRIRDNREVRSTHDAALKRYSIN